MAETKVIAEPGKQQTTIVRVFDAPRDLVFKIVTDPELVPQWWGPRHLSTTVEKMEVKPGGAWRFIQQGPDGNEYKFHGVYHDVKAPERLVYTFEFEGIPGHVLMETVTFEEEGDKTRMTDSSVFQSVEDRDGMLRSGMKEGARESTDRFEELVAKAAAR